MEPDIMIQIKPIKPRRISKAERVLDLIATCPNGMRTKQIQQQLYLMSNPLDPSFKHMSRGYWCTQLFGRESLLAYYCERRNGRWHRRRDRPHCGRPFETVRAYRRDAHKALYGNMMRYAPQIVMPVTQQQIMMSVV